MTHAARYKKLRQLTGRDRLDSSYDAAFYLLSSDEEISDKSVRFISTIGIDFEGLEAESGGLTEPQIMLVSIARNLFSWNSICEVTPFDISRLGYSMLDYVCNSMYIAVGYAEVECKAAGGSELSLNMDRYDRSKKIIGALREEGMI